MAARPPSVGDARANVLSGGPDDDELIGYGGNDTLNGAAGDDRPIGDSPFPADPASILAMISNRPSYTNWGFSYAAQVSTRALIEAPQDMLVIPAARNSNTAALAAETLWTREEVAEIVGSGKQLFAYLDVAKINTYTRMWDPRWTARLRTQLCPPYEDGGECDGSGEVPCELVIAGCHAAPVLQV